MLVRAFCDPSVSGLSLASVTFRFLLLTREIYAFASEHNHARSCSFCTSGQIAPVLLIGVLTIFTGNPVLASIYVEKHIFLGSYEKFL